MEQVSGPAKEIREVSQRGDQCVGISHSVVQRAGQGDPRGESERRSVRVY